MDASAPSKALSITVPAPPRRGKATTATTQPTAEPAKPRAEGANTPAVKDMGPELTETEPETE